MTAGQVEWGLRDSLQVVSVLSCQLSNGPSWENLEPMGQTSARTAGACRGRTAPASSPGVSARPSVEDKLLTGVCLSRTDHPGNGNDSSQPKSPPSRSHKSHSPAGVSQRLHLPGAVSPLSSRVPERLISFTASQKAVPPALCVPSPFADKRSCTFTLDGHAGTYAARCCLQQLNY